jgi:hypothetical protein
MNRRTGLVVSVAVGLGMTVTTGADDGLLKPDMLKRVNVEAQAVEYKGKAAVRLVEAAGVEPSAETLAVISGVEFGDGTIEVWLSGAVRKGAFAAARGFVGLAFRVQQDLPRYECFYLRPTNARAESQLRRNHTAQYVSHPDHPWRRLREETPGLYESYVDLVPGEWTRVRIVVSGTDARLYVHDAEQPSLIVKDLKLGESKGTLALWIGPGTEAHFADLKVTP